MGISPREGSRLAAEIVRLRHRRYALFPAGLFDEYGWEMLLVLYAARAEDRAMTIDAVNAETGASDPVGQRWLRFLAETGHVVIDDGDRVTMTQDAAARIETWLGEAVALMLPLAARMVNRDPDAEADAVR